MAYRDKKSLEAQQALNELESAMYDIEISMEESDFVGNATEEEMKELQECVKTIKDYVKKVTAKEVEFKKREMRREVRKANEIVERVEERIAKQNQQNQQQEENEL